jgi:hypothetical protein
LILAMYTKEPNEERTRTPLLFMRLLLQLYWISLWVYFHL